MENSQHFPSRRGWIQETDKLGNFVLTNAGAPSRNLFEEMAMCQAWLFFGTLAEVFSNCYINVDPNDFFGMSDGQRVVTTASLPDYVHKLKDPDLWNSENARLNCERIRHCFIVSSEFIQNQNLLNPGLGRDTTANDSLILSIQILGETLEHALRLIWASSKSLGDILPEKRIWSMKSAIPGRTGECNCKHIAVEISAMASILEKGRIPCIKISEAGGEVTLTVMDNTNDYVAISHVWSDGLGNAIQNSFLFSAGEKLQRDGFRWVPVSFMQMGTVDAQWSLESVRKGGAAKISSKGLSYHFAALELSFGPTDLLGDSFGVWIPHEDGWNRIVPRTSNDKLGLNKGWEGAMQRLPPKLAVVLSSEFYLFGVLVSIYDAEIHRSEGQEVLCARFICEVYVFSDNEGETLEKTNVTGKRLAESQWWRIG